MVFASFPMVGVADLNEVYDYVIVGGGTAGCVLANRLSQDPYVSVLLIERGGLKDSWISRVPLLSSHFASDGSRSRVWKSASQEHVNGRIFELVGGNSMGGASKINAMLYTRGLPAEYNGWKQAGREGWSYGDMQPYFIKSETALDCDTCEFKDWHGLTGEWMTRSHKQRFWNHTRHIIQGTTSLGIPYIDDLNSPFHPSYGCAKMYYTIDRNGQRSSTLSAFLPYPLVKERKQRLHICTDTIVCRLEVSKQGGKTLVDGVVLQRDSPSTPTRLIKASREVIVAAGPIGSPQLLLLSGIGPGDHLKEHGITVKKSLPGVGSNLKDHLAVPVQYGVPVNDSLAKLQLRPWLFVKELFLYILFGCGLLLSPVLEISIFLQSRLLLKTLEVDTANKGDLDAADPLNLPDIEVMPISWGDVDTHHQGGLTFFVVTLRPTSSGTVRLASSDPRESPVVNPNYLATENDLTVMRQGILFAMRLKRKMAEQRYDITDAHIPRSDAAEDIDDFVKKGCQSTYHYTSTCRMAPEDDGGVVDDFLKVHGVERLRIGDSSVFPDMLSTHLVAGTVAVAERCADMIKEEHRSLQR